MRLPRFDYQAPASLAALLALLDQKGPSAVILAGGTDLAPRLKYRLVPADLVVSLKNVPGLTDIRLDGIMLRIGAMAVLSRVIEHETTQKELPGLVQALKSVGAAGIQHHRGTLGGNLMLQTRCLHYNRSDWWRSGRERCHKNGGQVCHALADSKDCHAVMQSDGAAMLAALSAQVVVKSVKGERILSVQDLFSGKGDAPFTLSAGEMVTEIQIPLPPPGTGMAYQKLRWRSAIDFPLVSAAAAAVMTKGQVDRVRLVLGGVGPAPLVIEEADALLRRQPPSEYLLNQAAKAAMKKAEGGIADNLIAPAEYRRRMTAVMAKRALEMAVKSGGTL